MAINVSIAAMETILPELQIDVTLVWLIAISAITNQFVNSAIRAELAQLVNFVHQDILRYPVCVCRMFVAMEF